MVLTFDIPDTFRASLRLPAGKALWRSVATSLLRAASPRLQIDPNELEAGVRMWNPRDPRELGEIFLFDDVPNGAGYAKQIEQDLVPLLRDAQKLVTTCSCESACYRCLLDYGNQFWHESLDRFAAADLLAVALDGLAPTISSARAEHCAAVMERVLSRLRVSKVTDDQGRIGVMVKSAVDTFVAAVPDMVGASRGQTTVNGKSVRLENLGDFQILRQPLDVIRLFPS